MNIFDIKFPKDKKFYSSDDEFVLGKKYRIHSMNDVGWGWKVGDILVYTVLYNDYFVFVDVENEHLAKSSLKEYRIVLTDAE